MCYGVIGVLLISVADLPSTTNYGYQFYTDILINILSQPLDPSKLVNNSAGPMKNCASAKNNNPVLKLAFS